MPLRPPAGYIRPGYDPLKVPNAPTIGTTTGGDASASVEFTAPTNVGGSAISAYYAVSNPGQFTGTGASSPVSVTGLTNGTAYTFTVWALNTYGPSPYSAASGSVTPTAPRGLFGGGNFAGGNTIQYITISTTGNSTDFGDLIYSEADLGACSSSTRALFLGRSKVINYVTIATTGDAANFGNGYNTGSLSYRGVAGCSNSTRGLWAGNMNSGGSAFVNTISYSTIATTGDGTYFGDLTVSKNSLGACSSTTRGVFGGGGYPGTAVIGYITIASTGNATSFGSLTEARYTLAGCSSSTRGLFGGGGSSAIGNVIDYITIATTGNATDFGDLTINVEGAAACSSQTRGVWGGSYGPNSNVMSYVTIASTGNATDFGDLIEAGGYRAGCSNAHGGLS